MGENQISSGKCTVRFRDKHAEVATKVSFDFSPDAKVYGYVLGFRWHQPDADHPRRRGYGIIALNTETLPSAYTPPKGDKLLWKRLFFSYDKYRSRRKRFRITGAVVQSPGK